MGEDDHEVPARTVDVDLADRYQGDNRRGRTAIFGERGVV
jgi:hypothetical protein